MMVVVLVAVFVVNDIVLFLEISLNDGDSIIDEVAAYRKRGFSGALTTGQ